MTSRCGRSNGLNPTVLVFYDCFGSFWFCLFAWLLHPSELIGTLNFFVEKPITGVLICLGGSLLAVSYNLTSFTLTKCTSSMTVALLSAGASMRIEAMTTRWQRG